MKSLLKKIIVLSSIAFSLAIADSHSEPVQETAGEAVGVVTSEAIASLFVLL